MYNIAVIFPSRGLLFTETLKELLDELKPYRHTIYWSHDNSLPDCFNRPLEKALVKSHTHILIVEDDMVLKPGILKELLDADEDIIACDYPIAECPSGTVLYDKDDNAIFSGTGFMLIKRKVLYGMPSKIFRADIAWDFKNYDGKVKFTARSVDPDKVYGHHDISFGLYMYINRKPIKVAKTILAQRKLKQKGDSNNNIGIDKIVLFDKYKKINSYLIDEEKVDKVDDLLVRVILDDKEVFVTKATKERLVKEGLVVDAITTYNNIIVDTGLNKKVIRYFKEK